MPDEHKENQGFHIVATEVLDDEFHRHTGVSGSVRFLREAGGYYPNRMGSKRKGSRREREKRQLTEEYRYE